MVSGKFALAVAPGLKLYPRKEISQTCALHDRSKITTDTLEDFKISLDEHTCIGIEAEVTDIAGELPDYAAIVKASIKILYFDSDYTHARLADAGDKNSDVDGNFVLSQTARGVQNPEVGDYTAMVTTGVASFGDAKTKKSKSCGAALTGTNRLVCESGSGGDYLGTTTSFEDMFRGTLPVEHAGLSDIASDRETMFNCFDRSLTTGTVCEIGVTPDCDPYAESFVTKAEIGCVIDDESLAETVDEGSRDCHAVCTACNAKAGLLFDRTAKCSNVSGACLYNNTADTINHATTSIGQLSYVPDSDIPVECDGYCCAAACVVQQDEKPMMSDGEECASDVGTGSTIDGECFAVPVGATGGTDLETEDDIADATAESVRPNVGCILYISCDSLSTLDVLTCPECQADEIGRADAVNAIRVSTEETVGGEAVFGHADAPFVFKITDSTKSCSVCAYVTRGVDTEFDPTECLSICSGRIAECDGEDPTAILLSPCFDSLCETDSTEEASCSRGTGCAMVITLVVKNYTGGSICEQKSICKAGETSCVRGSNEIMIPGPVVLGDSEKTGTLIEGCGRFAASTNLSAVEQIETCCLSSLGSSQLAVHNEVYGMFNAYSHEAGSSPYGCENVSSFKEIKLAVGASLGQRSEQLRNTKHCKSCPPPGKGTAEESSVQSCTEKACPCFAEGEGHVPPQLGCVVEASLGGIASGRAGETYFEVCEVTGTDEAAAVPESDPDKSTKGVCNQENHCEPLQHLVAEYDSVTAADNLAIREDSECCTVSVGGKPSEGACSPDAHCDFTCTGVGKKLTVPVSMHCLDDYMSISEEAEKVYQKTAIKARKGANGEACGQGP